MIPALVIFDCDGTLVDSEMLYNRVVSDILGEQGYVAYTPEECCRRFTGLTLTAMRAMLEKEEAQDMPFLSREAYISRAQARMDEGIEAVPGAAELIEQAACRGKICVASNGERSSVIKSLKLTGLFDYFGEDKIFTKADVARGKPAPDLFLFAAHQMGCDSAKALVIEDSVPGVIAGTAGGMDVYGFTGSHHAPECHAEALKKAGASKVYAFLIHITEALKSQNTSQKQSGMLAQ